MYCSISGEIPTEPVLSKKSGFLFEKRLIEKQLKLDEKNPITGEIMTEDDLVPVKCSKIVKPRAVTGTSVPTLLSTLQSEWDEVMLENFNLRTQLDSTRQELSQSLYQQDAACRVIVKLIRERDESRALLTSLQTNGYTKTTANGVHEVEEEDSNTSGKKRKDRDDEMSLPPSKIIADKISDDEEGVNETVLNEINAKCKELSSQRKSRKITNTSTIREKLTKFSFTMTMTPHKSDKPAIHSVDRKSALMDMEKNMSTDSVVVSGGADKVVILSNEKTGRVLSKLSGHSKKITSVRFHPDESMSTIFSASADKSIKVWGYPSTSTSTNLYPYEEKWTYSGFNAEVTGMAIHPTGNYMMCISDDDTWRFLDIPHEKCLTIVSSSDQSSAASTVQYHSCALHPDGLIFGAGTSSGFLKIWDIRVQKLVADCDSHNGSIQSVSFSENGYLVGAATTAGQVKIWDLRKIIAVKTFEFGNSPTVIAFDPAGIHFAIGKKHDTTNAYMNAIYSVKEWNLLKETDAYHSKAITGLVWGSDDSCLVSCSLDRSIKIIS